MSTPVKRMASSPESTDRPRRMPPSDGPRVKRLCDVSVHPGPYGQHLMPIWPQIPMTAEVGEWHEDDGRKVLEQAVKIAEDAMEAPRRSRSQAS